MDKQTLAVLIDADNVSPTAAQDIFSTVCRLGGPIISALQSQQVIKISSTGSLSLVTPAQHR